MSSTSEKYVCPRCKKAYTSRTGFFKTYSILYNTDGYVPVCKTCLMNLYDYFLRIYDSKEKAMQRLCMAFDIYYSDALFASCKGEGDTIVSDYIRKLNINQYKNKTFENTLLDGFSFNVFQKEAKKKKLQIEKEKEEKPIHEDDVEKWGAGFDGVDYEILNNHYKYLKDANPNCDSNQEIFINDLCYTKMMQTKASKENRVDDYKKLTESYIKTFQQAGLKTVQDTNNSEEFTFAVNGEIIERTCPAEFYKNQKLYRDFDGLSDYIKRNFLRPIKNLMTGTKDEDPEYYVKDDSDIDLSDE